MKNRILEESMQEAMREIQEKGGVAAYYKSMTPEQKANEWSQVLFFIGVTLLIIGLALFLPWRITGTDIQDYSGVGQAKILSRTVDKHYNRSKERTETRFIFDVLVTAANDSFVAKETLSSHHGWEKGDVVPLVYNVKNPKDFVLGTTPEEYGKWIRICDMVGAALSVAGFVCLLAGFRLRRVAHKTPLN